VVLRAFKALIVSFAPGYDRNSLSPTTFYCETVEQDPAKMNIIMKEKALNDYEKALELGDSNVQDYIDKTMRL
jgi:hypothetical protein